MFTALTVLFPYPLTLIPLLSVYASTARQFADVNAFLTLAATRHKIPYEELREKPRVQEILNAAREGKVPAYLVSSESSAPGFLNAI